ncbi:MAG: hypothetical protein V4617_09795 [Gemmatimonadota bacterium]
MHPRFSFTRAVVGMTLVGVAALAGCKDAPNASPTEPTAAVVETVTPAVSATPAILAPVSSTCAGYRKRLAGFKAVRKSMPTGTQRAARMDAQIASLAAMVKDACN